jgi:DNA-binding IclR family transcriptional regulator
MAFFASFGTSFGPASRGVCPADEERRRKDDEAQSSSSRVAKLPERVRAWRGKVSVPALEMLALIHRDYERAGYVAVPLNPADLADRLDTTPEEARRLLAALTRSGAVVEEKRLKAPSTYRPELVPPGFSRAALPRDPVSEIGAAFEQVGNNFAKLKADLSSPGTYAARHAQAASEARSDLGARMGIRHGRRG